MKQKKAFITGLTGQDGSYLAELLLDKGYEVFGLVRHSATPNYWRIDHIINEIELIEGDLTDYTSLYRAVNSIRPDEVYGLGAQSFVKGSFSQPILTAEVTGMGTLLLLEAIRSVDAANIKYYQASSSEQFGAVVDVPQSEATPFNSRSPYASAKLFSHYTTINYRDAYGIFACNGILFNHESQRRGIEFVTRKITDGAARIKCGLQDHLALGNLDSKRDWSHAADMVRGMWMMLQHTEPGDYVLASGQTHSVREFCDLAFSKLGLNYKDYVVVDPKFFRPTEVDLLVGDPSKARKTLGWQPEKSFQDLVEEMVEADLKRIEKITHVNKECTK